MYIEEYDGLPHGDWLRACVSLSISNAATAATGVIETILRKARNVPKLAVAVRVRFQPARSLTLTFFFLTPTSAEVALRKLVAGFSRLELSTGQTAALPKTPEDAGRILGAFGRWRSRLVVEAQGTGEPWYLPDFCVHSQLDELLDLADASSECLTYQCNFWPYEPSAQSLRQCARNVLKVENTNGVPGELLELQRGIRTRLATAEFLVEEYLGVDSIDLASELSSQLEGCFNRKHGRLRFPRLTFPFYETRYSDEIESGFHRCAISGSAPPEEWVEACSFDRLLEAALWRPSSAKWAAPPQPVQNESTNMERTRLPSVVKPSGQEDYAFVSYSRADHVCVSTLLSAMSNAGIEYWYDQHIPGAADWHDMLEERISSCSIFILMLSPNAAGSKYVRRELAYADSIGKPLLTVQLEPTTLAHGLKMTLGPYQMISADPLHFVPALALALAHVRSREAISQGT